MKKLEAWIITSVFVALIAVPIVAFATGARPEPNQNRPPTPLPDISVEGVLDRELSTQLDAYLEDALIIAPGAVAAEAWTDVVVGDSPSEDVTLGENGWLYYTFSLTRPCLSTGDVERFADAVARAQRVVEATGRKLIVAIAPDKAAIIPDFLPDRETCVHEVAEALQDLDGSGILVMVWDEMRRARANDRPIYFRLDTHWTNEGAGVMAEAIVEELHPGGWNEDAVRVVDTVDHEGDLTVLLGLPDTEPTEELESLLPGTVLQREIRTLQTVTGADHEGVVAVDFSIDGGPPLSERTLVLHDSYGWALTPMLAGYFEEATFIAESDPAAGHLVYDLDQAETIIFELVQRSVHELILDKDLAAGFVSAYADDLPVSEQGTRVTGERLEFAATVGDTYVVVELAPGADAAEAAYNDTTAKLNPDSPRAAFYVGGGGTMYFAGEVDYQVVSVAR